MKIKFNFIIFVLVMLSNNISAHQEKLISQNINFLENKLVDRLIESKKIDELVLLLKHKQPQIRNEAAKALIKLQSKEAINQIIFLLDDKDDSVCINALILLGHLQAKEAIPNIIKLLKSNDNNIVFFATNTLVELQAKEAIPDIINMLKNDKNFNLINNTITALTKLQAKEAIPDIINILKSSNNIYLIDNAIAALIELQSKEAIPTIINIVRSSNNISSINNAITALTELQAKEAIPDIVELLKYKNNDIRSHAITALIKLESEEVIPNITLILQEKSIDKNLSSKIEEILLNSESKAAIPGLILMLNNYSYYNNQLFDQLIKLEAKDSIPVMIKNMDKDDNKYEIYYPVPSTLYLLSQFQSEEEIENNILLLNDENWKKRLAGVILSSKSRKKDVTHLIKPLLNDEHYQLRLWALYILKEIDKDRYWAKFEFIQLFGLIKKYPLDAICFLMWLFVLGFKLVKSIKLEGFIGFCFVILSIYELNIILYVIIYMDLIWIPHFPDD